MQLRFKVAGMTDMGLVRTNNEDNFILSRNLSVDPMRWINNEACMIEPNGALLVVADGMGGMNAGEVASQIAIDTVKELFASQQLASRQFTSTQAVNDYLSTVVAEADRRIKQTAQSRPETRGMGTTIVIGWLREDKLYVAWCGDSRAYVYNKLTGLRRLTKDHSYVQTLVDAGKLTDDQAFDYPQSNIITRCLSDSEAVAEPECLPTPYKVADGDIIMLCTDGLCGMMRDVQTQQILQTTPADDLTVVCRNLIDGALRAGGADNVTVDLLQVISGAGKATSAPLPLQAAAGATASAAAAAGVPPVPGKAGKEKAKSGGINKLYVLAGALFGVALTVALFLIFGGNDGKDDKTAAEQNIDLISGRVDSLRAESGTSGITQVSANSGAATQGGGSSASANDVNTVALSAMAGNALSTVGESGGKQASTGGKGSNSGQPTPGKTNPGQPTPGKTATGDKDNPDAGQTEADKTTGGGKQKVGQEDKDNPKPEPAERTTTRVKVRKNLKQTLKDYKMSEDDFEKLNPELKIKDVKRGDLITVYQKQK